MEESFIGLTLLLNSSGALLYTYRVYREICCHKKARGAPAHCNKQN